MKGSTQMRMRKRMFWWIGIFLIVAMVTLTGRLGYITLVKGEEYHTMAAAQQLSDIEIGAKRGEIYDKNGNLLAQSGTVWTVNLTPVEIKESQRQLVADTLAKILSLKSEDVLQKTKAKTQYAKVKSKVEKVEAEKIRTFISEKKIKGVYLTEDTKRFYPQGTLASSVLGFTGSDNQGLAGIEYQYDDVLKGTPGRQISAKNAWNTDMPSKYEKIYPAVDGSDLKLTIDMNIQYVLEKYLRLAIDEYGIQQKICGMVINPNNMQILAMSTMPDYDPNSPFSIVDTKASAELAKLKNTEKYAAALAAAQQAQWRNKCVSDLVEPGSVFKVVTGSAALEEGVVKTTDHFYCSGSVKVGAVTYHCAQLSGHGSESFVQGMANSCNPVFIAVAQKMGIPMFSSYVNAYGFGVKTGIQLPGEAVGVIHKTYTLYDLLGNSFGQTIKVTPIQMATAVSAAINGGTLFQPQIVQQIIKENGSVVQEVASIKKRQIVSEETSKTIRMMMEQVVLTGGSKNAAVAGYRVGGKSGTSQKLDSEDSQARVASFYAFAPVENPKVAVMIVADEPTIGLRYGSMVSAPLCSKVLADILPYLGVEPQYTQNQLDNLSRQVPKLVDISVSEAQKTLTAKSFNYKVVGNGDQVVRQMPIANSTAPKGSVVILYTKESDPVKVQVPSFANLTYTQVVTRAHAIGLNVKPTGVINSDGSVAGSQSVAASAKVEQGTVIEVQFVVNDGSDMGSIDG